MFISEQDETEAATYRYTPYGEMTITRGGSAQGVDPLGQDIGYTGRWFDSEAGLWQYRLRAFSALTGRFLQRDPLGLATGPNAYEYCGSSPPTWRDPLGLEKEFTGATKVDIGREDQIQWTKTWTMKMGSKCYEVTYLYEAKLLYWHNFELWGVRSTRTEHFTPDWASDMNDMATGMGIGGSGMKLFLKTYWVGWVSQGLAVLVKGSLWVFDPKGSHTSIVWTDTEWRRTGNALYTTLSDARAVGCSTPKEVPCPKDPNSCDFWNGNFPYGIDPNGGGYDRGPTGDNPFQGWDNPEPLGARWPPGGQRFPPADPFADGPHRRRPWGERGDPWNGGWEGEDRGRPVPHRGGR